MTKFERCAKYPDAIIPTRGTKDSAGYDLYAVEDITVPSSFGESKIKPVIAHTGVKLYLPTGFYAAVNPRSSLPLKVGLLVPNAPGTIDADYVDNPQNEGEIGVELLNLGSEPIEIKKGDKLTQIIILQYHLTDDDEANEERVGGFGSTGK